MNIFNHPNPNPWTSLPFRINGPEVAWRFTNAQSGLSQCVKNQKLVQNVQSNMVDFVNVRFIIWKVWDVQPFLTHAVLKTRKHRAWRFASAAFCCHSCKRDDKLHQHHQHHHQQQNTHQLIITSQSRTKKPPKKIQHKLQSFFFGSTHPAMMIKASPMNQLWTKVKRQQLGMELGEFSDQLAAPSHKKGPWDVV